MELKKKSFLKFMLVAYNTNANLSHWQTKLEIDVYKTNQKW